MPSDTASATATTMTTTTTTTAKRHSGSRESTSTTQHSPGLESASQKPGAHKQARHVVGHRGLGTRNPSFGRNLGKINTLAANAEDGAKSGPAVPPISPRPKPGMKRNQSLGLMAKSASQSALRKNLSSGHLVRNSSAKHLSKSHRPEYHRNNSNAGKEKVKRKASPAPDGKHVSVHFDMGDDEDEDDAEEMEGVDDGWTEESASQSPSTTRDNTRDNTRSNTRSNSMILDPEDHPYRGKTKGKEEVEPPDRNHAVEDEHVLAKPTVQVAGPIAHDFAPRPDESAISHARKSSYNDATSRRPPDPELIAKHILQRANLRQYAAPQVSDISVTAQTEIPISGTASPANEPPSSATRPVSQGSAPMISRFLEASASQPGSKDSTPISPSQIRPTSSSSRPLTGTSSTRSSPTKPRNDGAAAAAASSSSTRSAPSTSTTSDMRRNQSVPAFGLSSHPSDLHLPSGARTPRETRTQQKLWLQRGLSNIEANSASDAHLAGMAKGGAGGSLGTGGAGGPDPRRRRTGASTAQQQAERVERELACVRRYRGVIEEGIERVRKIRGGSLAGTAGGSGVGTTKKAGTRSGATTPRAGGSSSSRATSPGRTGSLDGDAALAPWDGKRLEQLEEQTLEVRRRLWELQTGDMED